MTHKKLFNIVRRDRIELVWIDYLFWQCGWKLFFLTNTLAIFFNFFFILNYFMISEKEYKSNIYFKTWSSEGVSERYGWFVWDRAWIIIKPNGEIIYFSEITHPHVPTKMSNGPSLLIIIGEFDGGRHIWR